MTNLDLDIHNHPVRSGMLVFTLAAGALSWSTFVLWIMMEQLLAVLRG